MTEPDLNTQWQMTAHCTQAVIAATGHDTAGVIEQFREIQALDRGYPVPMLLRACIALAGLTVDYLPIPEGADEGVLSFTLVNGETGEQYNIDTAPPPLRWAARFLFAVRVDDHRQVIALWQSHPDSQAFTKAAVQLVVLVARLLQTHGALDLSGGTPSGPSTE